MKAAYLPQVEGKYKGNTGRLPVRILRDYVSEADHERIGDVIKEGKLEGLIRGTYALNKSTYTDTIWFPLTPEYSEGQWTNEQNPIEAPIVLPTEFDLDFIITTKPNVNLKKIMKSGSTVDLASGAQTTYKFNKRYRSELYPLTHFKGYKRWCINYINYVENLKYLYGNHSFNFVKYLRHYVGDPAEATNISDYIPKPYTGHNHLVYLGEVDGDKLNRYNYQVNKTARTNFDRFTALFKSNSHDAHIYCLPDQIRSEVKEVVNLIDKMYKQFGFSYHVELSTRPEDSMGTDEEWAIAEDGLRGALEEMGMEYRVNEGDGAFYGPKIDFHLKDCLGRTWQCGTCQLDMQLPQRFDATYVGKDGEKHRPVMLHRVALGSIERFIGILIENYAGKFPVWLAPCQVKVLSVSDKYNDFAKELQDKLFNAGIRVELDDRAEKVGFKIREAQLEKIPYMLVVGEKEMESGLLSVRSRDEGELGQMSVEDFLAKVNKQIADRENVDVEVL